jgi:mRNA interferase YafQ
MLNAATTKRFEKDVELARKRGKNLSKLREIMELLLNGKKLPAKCVDHWLKGNFVYRKGGCGTIVNFADLL